MDDFVAMGFRDLHRADEDVSCERVNRFVALDTAEAGIFISLISETCHKGPLENGVPPGVHVLDRPRFLLHLLVVPPSLDHRLQPPTDDPDPPLDEMGPQRGQLESIALAAG